MTKKSLYEDKVPCDCGSWKAPKLFRVEGFEVRGWQCRKCSDIEYSDDIDKVLMFKKLQRAPIAVKTREVGNTEVMTIPKQVSELMGIKKGHKLFIKPKGLKRFEVEVD